MPRWYDVRRNDQEDYDRCGEHRNEVEELADCPRENDGCAREGERSDEILRRPHVHDTTAGCQRGTENAKEIEAHNEVGGEVIDAAARLQQQPKDEVVHHRVEEGAEEQPDEAPAGGSHGPF